MSPFTRNLHAAGRRNFLPIVLPPVCPSFSCLGNKISYWPRRRAAPINFAKLKSNYRARGIPPPVSERVRDKGPRREESFHPGRIRLRRGGVRKREKERKEEVRGTKGVKGISIPCISVWKTNTFITKTFEYSRVSF